MADKGPRIILTRKRQAGSNGGDVFLMLTLARNPGQPSRNVSGHAKENDH